ncbi:MAG: hypothetical protein AAGI38_05475 [Bacteroidota bacterium]
MPTSFINWQNHESEIRKRARYCLLHELEGSVMVVFEEDDTFIKGIMLPPFAAGKRNYASYFQLDKSVVENRLTDRVLDLTSDFDSALSFLHQAAKVA